MNPIKKIFSFVVINILIMITQPLNASTIELDEANLDFEIYDLELDEFRLFESADVYLNEQVLLLPFNTVISGLEVNISYLKASNTIKGQLNGQNINLSLDNPESINWDISLIWVDEQLFIDAKTLGYILNSNIEINTQELNVFLSSKGELFPIQKRIERLNRKVIKQEQYKIKSDSDYAFIVEDQYQLITPAQGSVFMSYNTNEKSEQTLNGSINLFNDFLYHSSRLSLAKTSESELTKRLVFSRETSTSDEFLFGNINKYSFGDVTSVNNQNRQNYSGTGLTFSNYTKEHTSYLEHIHLMNMRLQIGKLNSIKMVF